MLLHAPPQPASLATLVPVTLAAAARAVRERDGRLAETATHRKAGDAARPRR
jgi:hypothetical protein